MGVGGRCCECAHRDVVSLKGRGCRFCRFASHQRESCRVSWTFAANFSRVGRTSLRPVTWGEPWPTTCALCERCYASHISRTTGKHCRLIYCTIVYSAGDVL